MRVCLFIFLIAFNCCFAQSEKGTYLSLYKTRGAEKVIKEFKAEALNYHVRNGDKVLDIGGNDGSLIIPLSIAADTIDYYLEDMRNDLFFLAPKTASFVSEKINPKIHFAIHTVIGNDSTIPLSGIAFDKVFIRETFHHFINSKAMLSEAKRLLAKNGELKIIEPIDPKKFKGCHLLKSEDLIHIVKENGFIYDSTVDTLNMIIYTFRQ